MAIPKKKRGTNTHAQKISEKGGGSMELEDQVRHWGEGKGMKVLFAGKVNVC